MTKSFTLKYLCPVEGESFADKDRFYHHLKEHDRTDLALAIIDHSRRQRVHNEELSNA